MELQLCEQRKDEQKVRFETDVSELCSAIKYRETNPRAHPLRDSAGDIRVGILDEEEECKLYDLKNTTQKLEDSLAAAKRRLGERKKKVEKADKVITSACGLVGRIMKELRINELPAGLSKKKGRIVQIEPNNIS